MHMEMLSTNARDRENLDPCEATNQDKPGCVNHGICNCRKQRPTPASDPIAARRLFCWAHRIFSLNRGNRGCRFGTASQPCLHAQPDDRDRRRSSHIFRKCHRNTPHCLPMEFQRRPACRRCRFQPHHLKPGYRAIWALHAHCFQLSRNGRQQPVLSDRHKRRTEFAANRSLLFSGSPREPNDAYEFGTAERRQVFGRSF